MGGHCLVLAGWQEVEAAIDVSTMDTQVVLKKGHFLVLERSYSGAQLVHLSLGDRVGVGWEGGKSRSAAEGLADGRPSFHLR